MIPHAKSHDERFLWERYDEAKQCHRKLICQHHPDRGGCTQRAAEINSIWRVLKERFAVRGIAMAVCLMILTGCQTSLPVSIMPPGTTAVLASKTQGIKNLVAPILPMTTGVLSALPNPGSVDIYSSVDLSTWEYLDTLPYTNSSMSVDMSQSQVFYRGQVSGISLNVFWDYSSDTNVTGYFIYTGSAPNQFTCKYDVGLVTNAEIFVQSSNVAAVIYLAATSYNSAGWESDFSPVISMTPSVPVLNIEP